MLGDLAGFSSAAIPAKTGLLIDDEADLLGGDLRDEAPNR